MTPDNSPNQDVSEQIKTIENSRLQEQEKLRVEKEEKLRQEQVKAQEAERRAKRALFKKEAFNKEICSLMDQSTNIIMEEYGNPEHVFIYHIDRYRKIYKQTAVESHYQYFERFWSKNRSGILGCLDSDRWLLDKNSIIQYGEGIPSIDGKCPDVRIDISEIFQIACDLQEKAEESAKSVDKKFSAAAGGNNLIRKWIILLHLTRIFYHLNDGHDKEEIGKVITILEDKLNVPNKTVNQVIPGEERAGTESPVGFSGLFSLATGMMEKMGMKPPPNMKPPTEGEINTVLKGVFASEQLQNTISSIFSSVQGSSDIESLISNVIKSAPTVGTPGVPAVSSTAIVNSGSLTGPS